MVADSWRSRAEKRPQVAESAVATALQSVESTVNSSLVSVVLPTFNRARTLARAIDSVLRQDHSRLELIVVDDGSEDETPAIVSGFADARLRLVTLGHNRGQSAARNVGIALAAGELVAFQDSDDEWLPAKLSVQLKALATAGPEAGVVYCDMIRVFDDSRRELLAAPVIRRDEMFSGNGWVYGPAGLGIQTCLIRRALLRESGGFEEGLRCFEDLELLLRLVRRCDFVKTGDPLVLYHETDGVSVQARRRRAARRLLLLRYGTILAWQRPLGFLHELLAVGASYLRPPNQ
jgi:glycosyltransferase involved in cell wall biosynthesis